MCSPPKNNNDEKTKQKKNSKPTDSAFPRSRKLSKNLLKSEKYPLKLRGRKFCYVITQVTGMMENK